MQKITKISLFSVTLIIIAIIAFYFLSSSAKKELSQEIKQEATDELASAENVKNNEEIKEINDDSLKNTDPAVTNTKNDPDVNTEEKSKNKFQIIQKLVSWGYSASNNRTIDTIVIHSSYNAFGDNPYDLEMLLKEYKSYGVSPHYLIDRSGDIYQLVKDKNIAYHAGVSQMPDKRTSVNNFSIGIEVMTTKNDKLTASQYQSLNSLISNLKTNYMIKNILGHNQIALGRKTDPWNFDWKKLK